jgi:CRISPR-associated protein Cas1
MSEHLNTLFITTQGAYLARDHATLQVKLEGKAVLTVPLHHLEGVVCFGRVSVSPAVIACCGPQRLSLAFLSEQGHFHGRLEPPVYGNVLLRRAQYRQADDPPTCLHVARPIIAAKIQNARNTLLRAARDDAQPDDCDFLRAAAKHMGAVLEQLAAVDSLDAARGIEGETARTYFGVFSRMVRQDRTVFALQGRNRRPPRDPVNALLSFVYGILRHDCTGALESVGLDPTVGFLHADRPGRPSLALDLMEEFRTLIADRSSSP